SRPRQYEFARLNLNYTVTSKRKLKQLVDEKVVSGWDDPRMPTLAGMRRRGFTPQSLRAFCNAIGVTRSSGVVDVSMLEHAIRDDLNERAPRAMCVLRPLKVVLENYPEGQVEQLELPNHPQQPDMGSRQVPWTREIFIDREDFEEVAPRKWKRLATGESVRLRGGYVITCQSVVKDSAGVITELRCTYDPATLGVNPEGYKANGVVHWVSASHSHAAEIRVYDRLFNHENPDSNKEGKDFKEFLNPESLVVLTDSRVEASLAEAASELPYQFEREGYYFRDPVDSRDGKIVFNRTVTLRDSWVKESKGG